VVDFEVVSEGCVSTIGEVHGRIRLGARLLGGGVVCGVDVVGDRSIVVVGDGGIVSDAGTAFFGCEGATGVYGQTMLVNVIDGGLRGEGKSHSAWAGSSRGPRGSRGC
jgi:hypothetical protein